MRIFENHGGKVDNEDKMQVGHQSRVIGIQEIFHVGH